MPTYLTEKCMRAFWKARSRAFLAVARRERPHIPASHFESGIAFWCQGFPAWYRKWLLARLELVGVSLHPGHIEKAKEAADRFAELLVARHRTAIFLLGDAAVLARSYDARGGKAIPCPLSRSALPYPTPLYYLELFDVVNRTAAVNRQPGYAPFYRNYRKAFDRYVKHRREVISTFERLATPLTTSGAKAIADTGMQGTLALALAATLERMTGCLYPVHLAVAYPWLSSLVNDTTVANDAVIALALERTKDGHHINDATWSTATRKSASRA